LINYSFPLRFPGQYRDSESGLHYNYFRDYEAGSGRYVQSDPIGIKGGIASFSYAASSPLMLFDSDGLAPKYPKGGWFPCSPQEDRECADSCVARGLLPGSCADWIAQVPKFVNDELSYVPVKRPGGYSCSCKHPTPELEPQPAPSCGEKCQTAIRWTATAGGVLVLACTSVAL